MELVLCIFKKMPQALAFLQLVKPQSLQKSNTYISVAFF